jgi:diadenosine tetraphosphate (Ap4A) HIT family hydrolase
MENCIFCNKAKIIEDIVYENGNFFVKVGFSLVSPGHSMLISNHHYPCFGDLPAEIEKEFEIKSRELHRLISNEFYEPFQIEYGNWGQSVFHAHSHFIPLQGPEYKVYSIIDEMVKPENIDIEKVDRKKLKEIYKLEGSYVSIKEKGQLYLLHTKGKIFDHDIHSNVGFRYNSFFTIKKGLDIPGWIQMEEKHKFIDEQKRNITRQTLSEKLN